MKAKVVRGYVDKMITLAKDGSLHARRQVRRTADSSRRTSTAAAAKPAAAARKSSSQPAKRDFERVVMLSLVVHGVCSVGILTVSGSTLQRAGSCPH